MSWPWGIFSNFRKCEIRALYFHFCRAFILFPDGPVLLRSFPAGRVNASREVQLECTFQMFPLSAFPYVSWLHNNVDVTQQQQQQHQKQQQQQQHKQKDKYEVQQSIVWSAKYHYVVTSKLFIRNLTFLDSSRVVCSANNGVVEKVGSKNIFDLYISCK